MRWGKVRGAGAPPTAAECNCRNDGAASHCLKLLHECYQKLCRQRPLLRRTCGLASHVHRHSWETAVREQSLLPTGCPSQGEACYHRRVRDRVPREGKVVREDVADEEAVAAASAKQTFQVVVVIAIVLTVESRLQPKKARAERVLRASRHKDMWRRRWPLR